MKRLKICRTFNETRRKHFDTSEMWLAAPERVWVQHNVYRTVSMNASFVFSCYRNKTNLKDSRQHHGNKKYGGRGLLRVLNSVNCDCVTQDRLPELPLRWTQSHIMVTGLFIVVVKATGTRSWPLIGLHVEFEHQSRGMLNHSDRKNCPAIGTNI